MDFAEPVTRLVEQFKKLPGIGTKSAQRLAFFILKMDNADAAGLAETILEVKRSIRRCSVCNNLTDVDPCQFCTHPSRSENVLCVVEESNNILPVEKTHEFKGRYHVLMGSISPLKGVSPDQLAIASLLKRLQGGTVEEVIIATNPNVEGETTALYLSRLIKPLGIRVTRLALGLPVGGDLEYADEVTMAKALERRSGSCFHIQTAPMGCEEQGVTRTMYTLRNSEAPMKTRFFSLMFLAVAFAVVFSHGAQTQSGIALTGRITSTEEGPMEGVLVSAKKAGSTITITVVSDEQGRYRFPSTKLQAGQYALRIRAVGYDLEGPREVAIAGGETATADLKLAKTRDLAAQLSNSEWLESFPGSEQEKASIRACTHCHTLERVARSRYDVEKLTTVIERMSTYPQLSFPMMIQKLVAARIGGGEDPIEQRRQGWQRQARYLSTLNLSSAPQWNYSFKTHPRPKGKATKVIYTEYDLPQRTRQPHDVIVDSRGIAWYASFGEQILGKLDPKTGKVTDYEVPLLKPKMPTGSLAVRFDEDENIWLGMQFQGGVAKFDQKTEKFQTWSLPPELNGDHVQVNQVSPEHHKVDGKVWLQDAGTYNVLRLDVKTGKFEVFEPFQIPRPNIYDVISDVRNNVYFTVFGRENIGRIDAKTAKISLYPTPTRATAPRRGMIDSQGKVWFGENRANRIGMFDPASEKFKEWLAPSPESWPYDATADKNGEVWSGGEFSDRVLRLNPETGAIVEYLLPRFTNIRRVFVDNSTTPVTFWVGNNHAASIVKLEPLD